MSLSQALWYYRDLGWAPIPILPATKRPPEGFPLKRYFRERPSERDLRAWFGGSYGIAVVAGAVSDNLCVRDFDSEEDYLRWARNHPRAAGRLPTSRTARGRHVYFTADLADVQDFSPSRGTILIGSDGELKAGGYALVPSSVHPTGVRYEWLRPPEDVPFVGDLCRDGLVPRLPSGTQEVIRPFSAPDEGNPTTGNGKTGHRLRLSLEQIIETTQPTGYGERHGRIFQLCRYLRAREEFRNAHPAEAQEVFREWFRLACPRIRTKDFGTSWRDFCSSWHRVRCPAGATIETIFQRTRGGGIERLESLCAALQRRAGDRPFFLDGRTAAHLLESPHRTVARWLRRLCREGRLQLVRKGRYRSGRASEYRYLGDRN